MKQNEFKQVFGSFVEGAPHCDDANLKTDTVDIEDYPTEGDTSPEPVAQGGYKTIVEKGDLSIYTNLPVEINGSIIVVGEKEEL